MAIKEQFRTIKDNWLIILIAIVLIFGVSVFLSGGFANYGSYSSSADKSYSRSTGGTRLEYAPQSALMESAPSATFTEKAGTPKEDERKITTTTDINTEVEQGEFLQAEQKLKSIITASDSLILQENVERLGEDKKAYYDGNYIIKVESSKLDAVAAQLKEIGEVSSFIQAKEDITESYKNLEIEIGAEKQRLERYQKILEEAQLVDDKIKLNDYIFNQERTIKYLEDLLKNADKQVAYGTVYMEIIEKEPAYAGLKWIRGSELVTGFVNNVAGVIYLVVVLLPYAVVTILIWLAIRWMRRRSAKKKR